MRGQILLEKKSSIYQSACKYCESMFIGKTKRNLEIRAKERFRNIKNSELEKSVVGETCNGL